MASAILDAPRSKCPQGPGFYAISESTGRAYRMGCDRWDCGHCGALRKLAAAINLSQGIALAHEDGQRVRMVTLTVGPEGLDLPGMAKAWHRLRERLKRRGYGWSSYARVVEFQERGAPHYHVLAVGGGFIPQAELSEQAAASGFGPVADIRQVEPTPGAAVTVAEYLTAGDTKIERHAQALASRLPHYLTKQERAGMRDRFTNAGAAYIAPFSVSRKWPAGPLGETRAALHATWSMQSDDPDTGPWHVVHQDAAELRDAMRVQRGIKYSASRQAAAGASRRARRTASRRA
jgi:hypothetical protein